MSLYCVKQMSALHLGGGNLKDLFVEVVFMNFSGLKMGGLRPNAYNEYVTPYNKMILKERQFLHCYVYPRLLVFCSILR